MPWGKRTPNGRYQAERPEQQISKAWTDAANEALRKTSGHHGFAFMAGDRAVSELIEKNQPSDDKKE
jgi:hypothetical protein